MRRRQLTTTVVSLMLAALLGCSDDEGKGVAAAAPTADAGDTGSSDAGDISNAEPLEHPPEGALYDFANGCVAVGSSFGEDTEARWLRAAELGGDE